ncbi:MAG: hypothetical protein II756_00900 [Clostridia bacterium]|nr:hypothetical protein [Clostridia bacterium]
MSRPEKSSKHIRLTPVSAMHYVKLVYRSGLFLAALVLYVVGRVTKGELMLDLIEAYPAVVWIVTAVFIIEMVLRFFPSPLESPGCQKQFACNYVKTGLTDIRIEDNHGAVLVALVWIMFNMVFGALYMLGVLDDGVMLLLSLLYSVCDMICILFFCPFQTWFLKNKCCSSCRIYNWDYAMMFTPLFFIKNAYAWTLVALSFALLVRWEITFYKYPERFSERTNGYLKCSNCTEKLCAHKTQLSSLWVKIAQFTAERLGKLKK